MPPSFRPEEGSMVKRIIVVAMSILSFAARGDQPTAPAVTADTPRILPWHKPVYPRPQAVFVEGFKQAGYALVCGVKEMHDCLGFTNNCLVEISVNTDKCVSENRAHLPISFASPEEEAPVNRTLFACMTEKQRLSGKGQISLAACEKVNEMSKRSATPHQ
jgi:hypothetical protein